MAELPRYVCWPCSRYLLASQGVICLPYFRLLILPSAFLCLPFSFVLVCVRFYEAKLPLPCVGFCQLLLGDLNTYLFPFSWYCTQIASKGTPLLPPGSAFRIMTHASSTTSLVLSATV